MKKQSYMSKENILSEGVIDQVIQWFKSGKKKKAVELAQKKHPTIKNDIKSINKLNRDIEQSFKKSFGVKLKLKDYNITDYLF